MKESTKQQLMIAIFIAIIFAIFVGYGIKIVSLSNDFRTLGVLSQVRNGR